MRSRSVQGNVGIPLSATQAVFDAAGIGLIAWSGSWNIAGIAGSILAARWILAWFIRPPKEHADTSCVSEPAPRMGESIPIKDGSCIPADGRILQGVILVDESAVSGETKIRERRAGDVVFGGSMCKAGSAVVRVMRGGEESILGRNELLLSTPGFDTKTEQWIQTCGFTVFGIAAGTAIAVGWMNQSPLVAGSILIAGGGAELSAKIAAWIRSSIRRIQQNGAVLKTAAELEQLAEIRGLVFHKSELNPLETYTLHSLDRIPAVTENFVWESVAVAEKHSEHAIGRLLYRQAVRRIGAVADPERFHVYPGRGIWVRISDREILVGNAALFTERGVAIHESWHGEMKDAESGDRMQEYYVAVNGSCVGRLRISIRPQENSWSISEALKKNGIVEKIYVSADPIEQTGRQAEAWGIEQFHPAARPDDVWRELDQLSKRIPTALIGDGVSDAQAMLRADLGIIPDPTGTAAIRDNNAIILLSDHLTALPIIIRTAQTWLSGFRYASVFWLVTVALLLVASGFGWLGAMFIAAGRLLQAGVISWILNRNRLA
ncbi:HAD family hydrolase [Candidatus Uhrbacteria bacterium]|nr:HAD family hydrolase [Candidatus Uhrbacteria bacterium]